MIEIQPIITATGAAFLYSLLWYSRQVIDPTKPTPDFDPFKLVSTIFVGICVGILTVLSGASLTQAGLEAQLLSYGFIIALVEQVGKALYRAILVKFPALQEV